MALVRRIFFGNLQRDKYLAGTGYDDADIGDLHEPYTPSRELNLRAGPITAELITNGEAGCCGAG